MTETQPEKEARYIRNPDFIFRRIIDEMVLVPIHADLADMDSIYALNELGAFLWEQLAQAATVIQLQEAVVSVYDAEPADVERDIKAFLEEMQSFGAIQKALE